MAGAAIGVAHCLALPSKFRILSLNASSSSSCSVPFTSLGFSSNLSQTVFSKGNAMQPYNSTYPSLFLSFCKWVILFLLVWFALLNPCLVPAKTREKGKKTIFLALPFRLLWWGNSTWRSERVALGLVENLKYLRLKFLVCFIFILFPGCQTERCGLKVLGFFQF